MWNMGMLFSLFAPVTGLLSSSYHAHQVPKIKTNWGQTHKWVLTICHIPHNECIFFMKSFLSDAKNLFLQRAYVVLLLSNTFNESKIGPKWRNKQMKIIKKYYSAPYPWDLYKNQIKVLLCHCIPVSNLGPLAFKKYRVFKCWEQQFPKHSPLISSDGKEFDYIEWALHQGQ